MEAGSLLDKEAMRAEGGAEGAGRHVELDEA